MSEMDAVKTAVLASQILILFFNLSVQACVCVCVCVCVCMFCMSRQESRLESRRG